MREVEVRPARRERRRARRERHRAKAGAGVASRWGIQSVWVSYNICFQFGGRVGTVLTTIDKVTRYKILHMPNFLFSLQEPVPRMHAFWTEK
jgi:hypothetical protein